MSELISNVSTITRYHRMNVQAIMIALLENDERAKKIGIHESCNSFRPIMSRMIFQCIYFASNLE